mgnify:CR=1 FL=1
MPDQNDVIPIYLFLGFLESGKTKFIQETLEDRRFNKGEKTLLLICEEGVEEYDISRMPKKNIVIHVIEEKEDFTMENFTKILKDSGAERIVVEYNGMWTMDEFFKAMPDETTIAQVMCFVDSTTFMNYNSNMRSLVVDKLNVAEMVVFNRFDETEIAFLNQVEKQHTAPDITFCNAYHKSQVCFSQIFLSALSRLNVFIAIFHKFGEFNFLLSGQKRNSADFFKIHSYGVIKSAVYTYFNVKRLYLLARIFGSCSR